MASLTDELRELAESWMRDEPMDGSERESGAIEATRLCGRQLARVLAYRDSKPDGKPEPPPLRADVDLLVAACTSHLPADAPPEVTAAFGRLLDHWNTDLDGQDEPEPVICYALVEQMGHRSTIGTVVETVFCGRPMLAVQDLRTGREHLMAPDSLYEITWMSEDEARKRTAPYVPPALPPALTVAADDDDDPWAGDGYDSPGAGL